MLLHLCSAKCAEVGLPPHLDIRSSAQPQVSTIELEKKRDLDHNPEQPIYHETEYHFTNSLIKNESTKGWHWQLHI